MKKIVFVLFIISLVLFIHSSKEEKIVIPSNSIRYRIIANSNSFADQEEKYKINSSIEPVLKDILSSSNTLEESRTKINDNLNNIRRIINDYDVNYSLNYGNNYFPEKEYKGVMYPEGNYESLVITLGSGLGDNWWCVLFPPLCLLEAQESNLDDVEYSFYLKDIINKYK